jgi:hypothetical protein
MLAVSMYAGSIFFEDFQCNLPDIVSIILCNHNENQKSVLGMRNYSSIEHMLAQYRAHFSDAHSMRC